MPTFVLDIPTAKTVVRVLLGTDISVHEILLTVHSEGDRAYTYHLPCTINTYPVVRCRCAVGFALVSAASSLVAEGVRSRRGLGPGVENIVVLW